MVSFTSRQLKLTLHSCRCTWRLKWKLRDPICSSVMTVLFEGRKGSSGAAGIFPHDLLAFLPSPSDRCVNLIISKDAWINNQLWAWANLKRWRNVAAACFLKVKHRKRTDGCVKTPPQESQSVFTFSSLWWSLTKWLLWNGDWWASSTGVKEDNGVNWTPLCAVCPWS